MARTRRVRRAGSCHRASRSARSFEPSAARRTAPRQLAGRRLAGHPLLGPNTPRLSCVLRDGSARGCPLDRPGHRHTQRRQLAPLAAAPRRHRFTLARDRVVYGMARQRREPRVSVGRKPRGHPSRCTDVHGNRGRSGKQFQSLAAGTPAVSDTYGHRHSELFRRARSTPQRREELSARRRSRAIRLPGRRDQLRPCAVCLRLPRGRTGEVDRAEQPAVFCHRRSRGSIWRYLQHRRRGRLADWCDLDLSEPRERGSEHHAPRRYVLRVRGSGGPRYHVRPGRERVEGAHATARRQLSGRQQEVLDGGPACVSWTGVDGPDACPDTRRWSIPCWP